MAAILTHSGRMVDLLDVKPEDIDLDDIAHSLAQTCRFVGHTKRHYSVAEHSINVARLLPEPIKIYGLLHDAHEAYVGDISTPLKRSLEGLQIEIDDGSDRFTAFPYFRQYFRQLEDHIDAAIYSALGVPPPGTLIRDAVKYADATMAVKEMRDLFEKQAPAGQWGVDETLPVPEWGSLAVPGDSGNINWAVIFRRAVEGCL